MPNITRREQPDILVCRSCGNAGRFVEVMAYESHIVNSKLDYIRLLDAEVDHYRCAQCDRRVEPYADLDTR